MDLKPDLKPDVNRDKTRISFVGGKANMHFYTHPESSVVTFTDAYLQNCGFVAATFTINGAPVLPGLQVGHSPMTLTVSGEVAVKLDPTVPPCSYLLKSSDGRHEVSVSFPANTPFSVIAAQYFSVTNVSVYSFKMMFEGREMARTSCPEVEGIIDGDQIDIVGEERGWTRSDPTPRLLPPHPTPPHPQEMLQLGGVGVFG